ncbi:MAG: TonB-dependent receptor [Leptospiraceae bacterium]|nr:TonB-dependent receptor [Leptospiraceae bacterium]
MNIFKNIRFIAIFLLFVLVQSLIADGSTSNTIYIGTFLPYKSKEDVANRDLILENLKSELTAKGFEVKTLTGSNAENLKTAKDNNAKFYLSGYYTRKPNGNLLIYGHVYNPDKGNIIDAINISDSLGDLSEVELPPEEIKIEDKEVSDRFSKKFSNKVKFNTARKENAENVDEYVKSLPIGKELNLPVVAVESKASDDVFKLLQQTEVVTASRTKESLIDVPATTMVITEQDFKNRGYTSLQDIFNDLPGFDVIGLGGSDPINLYQRGYRTPYTSRTLLMIDGIIQNDLWTQVGTVDRTYPISGIKRVEIIYGPASAVYGPNAFQGIINIITKTAKDNGGKALTGRASLMYGTGPNWTMDGHATSQIGELGIAVSARTTQGEDENNNVKGKGFSSPFFLRNPNIWGPVLFYGDLGKPFGTYRDSVNNWGTILSATYKTLKIGSNLSNKDESYGGHYPGDKAQTNAYWSKRLVNVYAENTVEITPKLTSYTLALARDTSTYGTWAEADGSSLTKPSYVSITNWRNVNSSILVNQNIEYKVNDNLKILAGLKYEAKKLTKFYDIPGYWWGSTYFSSVDALNPNVNKGVDKDPLHQNGGYSVYLSTDPIMLKGPSGRGRMPEENMIGTYDRGGFLLSIIDIGKFRFSPGIRYDENSVYGKALNPRITAIYKLQEQTAIKLLYGEAFNEPPPLLLYGGFSGRVSDANLRPEKVKTTELVLMRQGKQISNEASFFYSRYEDVIRESGPNGGRRRIYGLEYKFKWNFNNFITNSLPISFYTYYTYTLAQSDTYYDHNMKQWKEGTTPLGQYEYLYQGNKVNNPLGAYYDGPASYIPRERKFTNLGDVAPHKINIGINLPIKETFILNFRGNYVSAREFYSRNVLNNNGPLPDIEAETLLRRSAQQEQKRLDPYFVIDTGFTYNFKELGFFTFKIMNLFNEYYVHPGVGNANAGNYYYARSTGYDSSILPQPGRSFMMNLTITF